MDEKENKVRGIEEEKRTEQEEGEEQQQQQQYANMKGRERTS